MASQVDHCAYCGKPVETFQIPLDGLPITFCDECMTNIPHRALVEIIHDIEGDDDEFGVSAYKRYG